MSETKLLTENATPVAGGQSLISNVPVDESVRSHMSSLYWEWKRLFERLDRPTLQDHPDVVLQHTALEEHRLQRSSSLLVETEGDTLRGVAVLIPKRIQTRRAGAKGIAPALNGLRLSGRILTDGSEGVEDRLFQAIMQHMKAAREQVFLLEDLETDTTLHRLACSNPEPGLFKFSPTDFQSRYRISLPKTMDEFWATFSSKARYNLRREIKKLGEAEFRVATTPEEVGEFLEMAHQVSLNTWQTQQLGLRIEQSDREVEMHTHLAQLGLMRSYLLVLEGKPIAFAVGSQQGGNYELAEIGYDRDYAKLSPGKVLILKTIEELLANTDATIYDFGVGDAEYKRLLANEETSSGTLWIMPKTLRNRFVLGHLHTCRFLRGAAKTTVQKLGVATKIRQWSRARSSKRN